MADKRPGGGLQIIFGIFLGLMVGAFIGVGVYTFYPSPDAQVAGRIQELNREEQAINVARPPDALTSEDRARIREIMDERDALVDERRAANQVWGRRTSIILVAFATLAMAISLLRAAQLPVISNGLLLGGVFTMLYGVGWIIATDTSTPRFIVMTVALLITLVLGYVRFARRHALAEAGAGESAGPGGDLEQRVRDLEERMDDAANALSQRK